MRSVPRLTIGADTHTITIPKTALAAMPTFDAIPNNSVKILVKNTMAQVATITSRTMNPRCTSTYRAMRFNSTVISSTRCLTTAEANDKGKRNVTTTNIVLSQNEG